MPRRLDQDSYWVFMPFKLKDSGVTLKYSGKSETADGKPADVLELTFKDVGRTPENKYHVYVDEDSRLVTQWDYYENASDPEPRFQMPWQNWQKQGGIMLSADRGERARERGRARGRPRLRFREPSSRKRHGIQAIAGPSRSG